MSYQADKGPRVVAGIIGLAIVGFFFFVMAQTILPYFYGEYQSYKLRQCEEKYEVEIDAWESRFGFDWGGRNIVGDSQQKRALIRCITNSQQVSYSPEPLNDNQDDAHPSLTISYSAFSYGLHVDVYEGSNLAEADNR